MKFVNFFLSLFCLTLNAQDYSAELKVILGYAPSASQVRNLQPTEALYTRIQNIHFELLKQQPFEKFTKQVGCLAPERMGHLFSLNTQQIHSLCHSVSQNRNPLMTRGRSTLPRQYVLVFSQQAPIAESWTNQNNVTFLVVKGQPSEEDLWRKLTHEAAILLDSRAGAYISQKQTPSCVVASALTNPTVRIAGSILRAWSIENEILKNNPQRFAQWRLQMQQNVSLTWAFALEQALQFKNITTDISARMNLCDFSKMSDVFSDVSLAQTQKDIDILMSHPELLKSIEIPDLGYAFTGSQFSPRPRTNGSGW